METVLWGGVLRFLQALIEATPTILVGLIVAGVFHRLLAHSGTRQLFGTTSTWRSLPQAWLIGMLLPVCSLGVIPIVREMKRAGVSGGTILAFGLTAPLFNPISVLYGLTLADPLVILTFSFCSLVIVTVVGLAWDRLFPNTSTPEPEPASVPYGAKRMLSIGVYAARELAGPTTWFILLGLIGVAVLAMLLPHGYLQTAAEHDDPWAPLFMAAIAIPIYATPMTAMPQLAAMFQHGNSVGAAFALLALGAGVNIGLLAWIIRGYGVRRCIVWFALLVAVVVGLAYGVDKPLYPQGVEAAGHTHAFDRYCAPFHAHTRVSARQTFATLGEDIAPDQIVSLIVVSAFMVAGLLLHRFDPTQRVEAWLESAPERTGRLDVAVPGPVLGGLALVGLVGLSVLGCFVYYPPPGDILDEMRIANTEVVAAAMSQDWETALYWIPIYDDWTRKLQVSMFLRGKPLTPYRRAKANVLRDKLEMMEHEVEDQRVEESRELGLVVMSAYSRMREAYSGNGLPSHAN